MSDPAKTPEEIEDVLASVRRLVSDHAPSREEATAAPSMAPPADATPTPAAAPTEALILTPSFRVADPEDPWVPVASAEDAVPDEAREGAPDNADGDEDNSQASATEDLIAEIVTAEETGSDAPKEDAEWQPEDRLAAFDAVGSTDETSEPTEWVDDHSDTATEGEVADLLRLDGSTATAADFESETGDDNWPESSAEAALLTLVARRDPSPTSDEAAEDTAEDTAEDAAEDSAEDAPEVADEQPEASEEQDAPDEAAPAEAASLEAEDASDPEQDDAQDAPRDEDHPETAPTEEPLQEDTAPEAEAQDEDAPEPAAEPEILDATQDAPAEELEDTPVEDLGDTPQPFTFPDAEEGFLDEETLREIIVDVVREELQGVLGQRITRNVRKMVRREIRLALAAEDLE